MAERIELHGIQAIPHKSNGGLGALETIFSYYGEQIFEPENTQDLAKIAEASGFKLEEVKADLSAIVTLVTGGTPVLVRYRDKKERKHGVVTGYWTKSVKLMDTSTGSVEWVDDADFESMLDNFAATVMPASKEFSEARDLKLTLNKERKARGR